MGAGRPPWGGRGDYGREPPRREPYGREPYAREPYGREPFGGGDYGRNHHDRPPPRRGGGAPPPGKVPVRAEGKERPNRTLFVRNFDFETPVEDIRSVFGQYGEIKTLFDLVEKRGISFITFFDLRAAMEAKRNLHGYVFGNGRRGIDIHYNLPRPEDYRQPCTRTSNQGTIRVSRLNNGVIDRGLDPEQVRDVFGPMGDVKVIRPERAGAFVVDYFDARVAVMAADSMDKKDAAPGATWDVTLVWDIPARDEEQATLTAIKDFRSKGQERTVSGSSNSKRSWGRPAPYEVPPRSPAVGAPGAQSPTYAAPPAPARYDQPPSTPQWSAAGNTPSAWGAGGSPPAGAPSTAAHGPSPIVAAAPPVPAAGPPAPVAPTAAPSADKVQALLASLSSLQNQGSLGASPAPPPAPASTQPPAPAPAQSQVAAPAPAPASAPAPAPPAPEPPASALPAPAPALESVPAPAATLVPPASSPGGSAFEVNPARDSAPAPDSAPIPTVDVPSEAADGAESGTARIAAEAGAVASVDARLSAPSREQATAGAAAEAATSSDAAVPSSFPEPEAASVPSALGSAGGVASAEAAANPATPLAAQKTAVPVAEIPVPDTDTSPAAQPGAPAVPAKETAAAAQAPEPAVAPSAPDETAGPSALDALARAASEATVAPGATPAISSEKTQKLLAMLSQTSGLP